MPRVYRWSAPVWQADVDAFGELRTSTLLKFLQETATRASTDAGFAPAYYRDTGTMYPADSLRETFSLQAFRPHSLISAPVQPSSSGSSPVRLHFVR